MRRLALAMALLWTLTSAVFAAGRPLHEDDAKRLEAFVLAENLLDFAARASSARAYLMAAELRLLYPVTDEEGKPSESIQSLLARGQALAPSDAAVQMWARQLSKLAGKSPRGEGEPLRRVDVDLKPGEVFQIVPPTGEGERLIMLAQPVPGLVMTLKGKDGAVLESTLEAWLYFVAREPLTLEISVPDGAAHHLTLLLR